MKLLLITTMLYSFSLLAEVNEQFSCVTEYAEKVSISLKHSRITNANVIAFDKRFHGRGSFSQNIIVKSTDGDDGKFKMIHIPIGTYNSPPKVMFVYHNGSQVPQTYNLDCDEERRKPQQIDNCDIPRNNCYYYQ